jgi:4-hydroxybenzoate polyprenyltransferase
MGPAQAPARELHPSPRSWLRPLASIRFDEVAVLQGPPLLGGLFAMSGFTAARLGSLAVLAIASCLLVAHVFVLNDWAGMTGDLQDPNRAPSVFVVRGVSRSEAGWLAITLLVGSIIFFAFLGWKPLAIALGIASASGLYSTPVSHAKGVALFSSTLHLVGGTLHFLLGYSLFRPLDIRGLVIGSFFGLTFMAGHFTHEARDHEGDSVNGIRTNAVRFGARRSFVAGLIVFTAAYALLTMLALCGVVPRVLMAAAAA